MTTIAAKTSSKILPTLNTEIEDGISIQEQIFIQTELAMTKAGLLQPTSMKETFQHLKRRNEQTYR